MRSDGNNLLKPLPIGTEDFAQLRQHQYYYIDKTELIRALLQNPAAVTLFTRPRRFGKTLNMSMLKWFFELPEEALYHVEENLSSDTSPDSKESLSSGITPDVFCSHLFEGLSIKKDASLCAEHMGKYPVISISLKNVVGSDFSHALDMMRDTIATEAMRFYFLKNSPMLTEEQHAAYQNLIRPSTDGVGNYAMSYSTLMGSLKLLTILLKQHYKKKVILLIDEYDVPLDKAHVYGYYDNMVELIRGMFDAVLKTNPALEFAVLTGCLRISKESIFTGMNNLRVDSITDPQFNQCFGFTDDEVSELLHYYGIDDLHGVIRDWYDGFHFAGADVYCPWDVIRYCNNVITGGRTEPQNYWINTSGNDIVRELIETAAPGTRDDIERLIAGEKITKALNPEVTYRNLTSGSDNIFNILFATGYLTETDIHRDENDIDWYDLEIPNREIRSLFRRQVREWFNDSIAHNKGQSLAFLQAMLRNKPDQMEQILNEIMSSAISIRDADTRDELKENFYHGMMLGLLVDCSIVRSNRESGYGYSDLLVKDMHSRTGVVLEFKYVKDFKDLDRGAEEALQQIDDLSYDALLQQEGMTKIISYGIAFCKKLCKVKIWQ